jgi:hypothetical protein
VIFLATGWGLAVMENLKKMPGKHGGARPGAGRKRKVQVEIPSHQTLVNDRTRLKAAALEQQQYRAIARGRLETASRIEAKRLDFLREDL